MGMGGEGVSPLLAVLYWVLSIIGMGVMVVLGHGWGFWTGYREALTDVQEEQDNQHEGEGESEWNYDEWERRQRAW